ncbi:uncharacterized protein LOC120679025 [Panicum virgatum]|uniref:uncharacterized protein LOC120679025 n=1 Tax=Panicum virgatum TaxID=38727 RepID=UPI0019D59A92|nr:uncharacterized protein LOC120679025 [Panicum virgatum]
MARSPFVLTEAGREQGAGGGGGAVVMKGQEEQEAAVRLVHSQVRRIKREDEEARERLLKLRLLETRPAGAFCDPVAWRASRSLSPLRRAGNGGIPVGE